MPVVAGSAYNQTRTVTNLVRSIVNDANPQVYSQIAIFSVIRTANVLQVTTTAPHGLIRGDYAVLAGVSGLITPVNGTFPVSQIINANQFTIVQAGGNEVSPTNQGFVGALGLGTWATDPLLMPHINSAYRKVQRAVSNAGGGGFIQDDVLVTVAALAQADASVQVAITDSTAPPNQLPNDLLVPMKIWERAGGSSDDFVEMFDMSQKGGLPSRPQGQTLSLWEWRADGLYFLGALQDVQIRLRYQAAFPDLVDGSSPILIRNAQDCIAFAAALSAGGARGSVQAEKMQESFDDALEDVIGENVKQMQHSTRRRKPFRWRNGVMPGRRW